MALEPIVLMNCFLSLAFVLFSSCTIDKYDESIPDNSMDAERLEGLENGDCSDGADNEVFPSSSVVEL